MQILMWQYCELPYRFYSISLRGLMKQVKSTHHTIDHFGSVKYAELVDPVLFLQTSTLLWKKSDKLHVHCDVTHKNRLSYPAITIWTTSVRHKQICDCFYGSVWPTGHDTLLWCKTSDILCYTYNKPLVYFWIWLYTSGTWKHGITIGQTPCPLVTQS